MSQYRIESQVLPMSWTKPHISSTLFCEFVIVSPHPFSTVAITSQLFAALLKPPWASYLLNSSQLLSIVSISSHLSPILIISCYAFSTWSISAHLFSPLLNGLARLNVSPLPTYSQPVSARLTVPPLFTRMLHTEKLLDTEAFAQGSLYTQTQGEAFTHRNFYTEAFAQRSFCTQHGFKQRKFTHRKAFTQRSFHKRESVTQRIFYTKNLELSLPQVAEPKPKSK